MRLSAVLLVLLFAVPAHADTLWIEAESLAKPPAGFKVGGWGKRHYLSGDQWLFASIDGKDVPADGAGLGYPFEIKTGGNHAIWAPSRRDCRVGGAVHEGSGAAGGGVPNDVDQPAAPCGDPHDRRGGR